MKIVMLPSSLIPGALDKNPNIIVPEKDLPNEKHYFFVAVGRKAPTDPTSIMSWV
jgi:hypothetical protein